jgi:Arc/MetJ family transcription regulator
MKITIDDVFITRDMRVWAVTERDETNYKVVHFAMQKQAKAYRTALLAARRGNGSMAAVEAARTKALPSE